MGVVGTGAMKLDVNVLRYLSKDEFRVLVAVEMGMRNVREYSHLSTLTTGSFDGFWWLYIWFIKLLRGIVGPSLTWPFWLLF